MSTKKHDLPYIPFYVGDWRKAPDIRALSLEERALWFEMLCLMWESPRRGYLTIDGKTPIDDKTLGRMIGEDISVITKIKQVLASVSIYSIEETTGIIFCRRTVRDEAIRLSKSTAGKLGMESRYKNKRKKEFCYNTSDNKSTNKSLTDSDIDIDIDIESGSDIKKGEFQERGDYNPDTIRLTQLLFDLIKERKIDFKTPDLNKWTETMDKILRLDHRSPEIIETVIRWCQSDDFWQDNILSPIKLRKHFDQLELKMKKVEYMKLPKHTRANAQLWAKIEQEERDEESRIEEKIIDIG